MELSGRKPVDHQRVACMGVVECCLEFGPAALRAGGLLGVDALAAGGLERIELERVVLLPGGNARLADQHEALPKLIKACHKRESSFKGKLWEVTHRDRPAFLALTDCSLANGRIPLAKSAEPG